MAAYLTLSPTMSILTVINAIMGVVMGIHTIMDIITGIIMGIPTDIPIGILTGIHFIMDLIHFSTAHSVLAHSSSIRSLVSTSGL
jgi:hypothetical protein